MDAILALTPPNVPRFHQTKIDLHVLAFTTFAAVLAGVLVGVWPAWRISHSDSISLALHEAGGRSSSDGLNRQRMRSGLVIMALGAQTRDVLQLVVRQGMAPVVGGLAIGIVAAFGLGRLVAAQLYQVSAHNPLLLMAAATLLAVAALVACLLPARRATHVNPIQALRAE